MLVSWKGTGFYRGYAEDIAKELKGDICYIDRLI